MLRLIVLTLCLSWLGIVAPVQAESPATITVTGVGQASAAPDMAVISLGVRIRAKTALGAVNATSEALERVLAQLEAQGVAARDMQTATLSLNQMWDRRSSSGEAEPSGFEASNVLTVRVRDLDRLGDVLEAALADGANALSGLRFGFRNPRPLQDDARRRAVTDAMEKARLYASAAGVTLGPLLSLSEGGASAPVMQAATMRMAEMASVPIAAGETEISAQVTMVFAVSD